MTGPFPIEQFEQNGFAYLPGFYDVATEIEPIREGVRQVVELVARKYGVDAPTSDPDEAMGAGFNAIVAANRAWGSEIYDAVKQLPAFIRYISNERNTDLFQRVRKSAVPGLAGGGHGIRMDLPGEEKYRSHWHQEFPFQLRSLDGIVYWSPLIRITEDMGPVEVAVGSNREGIVPIVPIDKGFGKTLGYQYYMDQEAKRLAKYERLAPCSSPGDLIIIDFLTLHQSGLNVSKIARWSMQFRIFNFADPTGLKIGWRGSFASHVDFAEVLPELAVGKP